MCAELREHLKEFEDKEDTRMKKLFISQPMQGKIEHTCAEEYGVRIIETPGM